MRGGDPVHLRGATALAAGLLLTMAAGCARTAAGTTPAAVPALTQNALAASAWLGGTVAVVPVGQGAAAALQVVWRHGGTPVVLGVIPGTAPAATPVLRALGRALLVETDGEDLWVSAPRAGSLRRVAQVPQGGAAAWGAVAGMVWWCSADGPCALQDVASGATVQSSQRGATPNGARDRRGHPPE